MKRFIFTLEPKQHAALLDAAAREGMSAAELVRRGIVAVLAITTPPQEAPPCSTLKQ